MKTFIEQQDFITELSGWAWRGILCAVPSTIWAVTAGFNHPAQVVAMVLVVGAYILSFAIGTTWLSACSTPAWQRFSRAMKVAAAIKAAVLVGAAGWWALSTSFLPRLAGGVVLLVSPDLCLGLGSMHLVQLLVGVREPLEIAQHHSFALTGLITFLQGAFLSVLLVLLALAVLSVQSIWFLAKRRYFLPASV